MNLQENINRIKEMMGILNEQVSGNLVGDNVYQAIKNIESVFGFIDGNGNIQPRDDLNGTENEALIKRVIQSSIGLDNWAKLDPKLKGQIYSFMFQSDSGVKNKSGGLIQDTRFRWLAGLAQSIDPSIDRTKIVDKPLNDINVQNAIKLVKDNIDKINYQSYINVVKTQYNNLSAEPYTDKKRKYIWGPRPDALHKLMSGISWDVVKKDWEKQINIPQPITPNPVIPNPQTQPTTTGTQTATTGGATSTATVQTTGGETPTNPQPATTEFKYPSIENSFKPTNGDPWEYAHDGTNLYVKNPKGSNKLFNLKDPNYFTKYPDSKLKTQDQVNNAIASIKNAYGKELGL